MYTRSVSDNRAPAEKSLKTLPETASDGAEVKCAGRLLRRLAAETGKARLPTVERIAIAISDSVLYSLYGLADVAWDLINGVKPRNNPYGRGIYGAYMEHIS